MNKRIESDDSSRNLILLVTLMALTDSNHIESTTVLFPQVNHGRFWETSCFTLANSDWPSLRRSVQSVPLVVTVLLLPRDRGRQHKSFVKQSTRSKPLLVSRQSRCRRPCHKHSGRLPLQSTRLVVTFPLTEHHHTLPCWVTEAVMRIICPKSLCDS